MIEKSLTRTGIQCCILGCDEDAIVVVDNNDELISMISDHPQMQIREDSNTQNGKYTLCRFHSMKQAYTVNHNPQNQHEVTPFGNSNTQQRFVKFESQNENSTPAYVDQGLIEPSGSGPSGDEPSESNPSSGQMTKEQAIYATLLNKINRQTSEVNPSVQMEILSKVSKDVLAAIKKMGEESYGENLIGADFHKNLQSLKAMAQTDPSIISPDRMIKEYEENMKIMQQFLNSVRPDMESVQGVSMAGLVSKVADFFYVWKRYMIMAMDKEHNITPDKFRQISLDAVNLLTELTVSKAFLDGAMSQKSLNASIYENKDANILSKLVKGSLGVMCQWMVSDRAYKLISLSGYPSNTALQDLVQQTVNNLRGGIANANFAQTALPSAPAIPQARITPNMIHSASLGQADAVQMTPQQHQLEQHLQKQQQIDATQKQQQLEKKLSQQMQSLDEPTKGKSSLQLNSQSQHESGPDPALLQMKSALDSLKMNPFSDMGNSKSSAASFTAQNYNPLAKVDHMRKYLDVSQALEENNKYQKAYYPNMDFQSQSNFLNDFDRETSNLAKSLLSISDGDSLESVCHDSSITEALQHPDMQWTAKLSLLLIARLGTDWAKKTFQIKQR